METVMAYCSNCGCEQEQWVYLSCLACTVCKKTNPKPEHEAALQCNLRVDETPV